MENGPRNDHFGKWWLFLKSVGFDILLQNEKFILVDGFQVPEFWWPDFQLLDFWKSKVNKILHKFSFAENRNSRTQSVLWRKFRKVQKWVFEKYKSWAKISSLNKSDQALSKSGAHMGRGKMFENLAYTMFVEPKLHAGHAQTIFSEHRPLLHALNQRFSMWQVW